jgi:hypothetical protein
MRYLVHAALIVSLLGACTDRGGDAVTDTGLVTDADGDGVPASEDCDDDPSGCGADCFPGNPAADTCDGYDNDCDDATDEDVDGTFYADCDGDGAFAATAVTACDADSAASPCADGAAPDGGFTATAPTTADCDDEDALANLEDLDGDGVSTCDGDCDDDPSGCGEDCFPGNSEPDTCDNADVDCDGLIGNDNGDDWYADCDGDADFAEEPVQSCGEPAVSRCDDGEAPDGGWLQIAPELPDCDDESAALNHADADGDGVASCTGDCDDDPNACGDACSPALSTDGCDTYDNDCDQQVDEDPDRSWYLDADGDGSTVGGATVQCDSPGSTFRDAASAEPDCNDGDASLNTVDADEDGETTCAGDCDDDPNGCGANCNTSITVDGCGGDDNDCDTRLDEDPGTTVWYEDADGDSWVASATGIAQCLSPGATYTTMQRATVHPPARTTATTTRAGAVPRAHRC